jgi:hypothetical protein
VVTASAFVAEIWNRKTPTETVVIEFEEKALDKADPSRSISLLARDVKAIFSFGASPWSSCHQLFDDLNWFVSFFFSVWLVDRLID